MSKVWVTSDHHFNHGATIFKFKMRNFASAYDMDKTMIDNWNSKINPEDIVYHLGDFAFKCDFKRYLKCLNGTIHLIRGNHDKRDDYHRYFASVSDYAEIKLPDNNIICCSHFAMRVWNRSHYGSFHCYGHSHGKLPGWGKSMDVGVDTHDYFPYEITEVVELLANKEIVNPVTKEDAEV